jgi:hypothetical protein
MISLWSCGKVLCALAMLIGVYKRNQEKILVTASSELMNEVDIVSILVQSAFLFE